MRKRNTAPLITRARENLAANETRAFDFLKFNKCDEKPVGNAYLEDLLNVTASCVDSLKFAGGSSCLYPRSVLEELIAIAHRFDVQVSTGGFITLPLEDWARLIKRVQRAGLKAKPELGIQFGAGAATNPETLARQGTHSTASVISRARKFLDLGVPIIIIESEGITETCRPGVWTFLKRLPEPSA